MLVKLKSYKNKFKPSIKKYVILVLRLKHKKLRKLNINNHFRVQ